MRSRQLRFVTLFLSSALLAMVTGCGSSDSDTVAAESAETTAQPVANPASAVAPEAAAPAVKSTITATPIPSPLTQTSALNAGDALPIAATRAASSLGVTPATSLTGGRAAAEMLTAEPSTVNMGQFATNETKASSVMLTNNGDTPITIERAKASCGCTTTGLNPGTVIGPGESIEVAVSLRGGASAQVLNKTVSFLVAGMDPLTINVRGQTVEYVKMVPTILDRTSNPEGRLLFRAIDQTPFRVTGISPPLMDATAFPAEAAVEHEIFFDWNKLEEFGLTRRITFHLDHPKSQQVFATVRADPNVIPNRAAAPGAANAVAAPALPLQGMGLVSKMFEQNQTDEVLKQLDDGLSLESKDTAGLSILGLACRYSNGDFVQLLVERGADIEATDGAGRTPLMTASQYKNIEAIRVLIDMGARVNARDRIGNTALSWAAGFGTPDGVTELIDNGAEIEAVSNLTGWTPLIWAAGFGDPRSVQVLVSAGANLEVGDLMQGATPLINAARTGKVESIEVLVAGGAQLESKDRNGKTALLAICENAGGTVDKLMALIGAGANLQAKDNRGKSALDLARARTDARALPVVDALLPYFENQGTNTVND